MYHEINVSKYSDGFCFVFQTNVVYYRLQLDIERYPLAGGLRWRLSTVRKPIRIVVSEDGLILAVLCLLLPLFWVP